jgi:hypothetical protein
VRARTRAIRGLAAACALLAGATPLLFPGGAVARSSSKSSATSRTKSGGGIRSPYGNDISYPQCGKSFPSGATFGLVGVDDGIANRQNPCLGPDGGGAGTSELYWGSRRAGGAGQAPVALYVNTADPSNSYNGQPIADWPKPGATVPNLANPYGQCGADPHNSSLGANSTGCAWVYGADIASLDASSGAPLTGTASSSFLSSAAGALQAQGASVSASASSYRWWLDVETANTWQPSSAAGGTGLAMNAAALEGMLQYLKSLGVTTVGVYSTNSQWQAITGGQSAIESGWSAAGEPSPSPLSGVPDWVPGAQQQSGAISACSGGSFTGGSLALTQWIQNSLDYDQAC